jgi:hypothetical protein
MDTGDALFLGVLGVGGFCAWRWYKRQPVPDAARIAPSSTAGAVASGMTDSGARTKLFGGGIISRRVLDPIRTPLSPRAKMIAPTAPASSVVQAQTKALRAVQPSITNAIFAPDTTAPAGSVRHYVSTGVLGLQGTAPAGDGPQPGDPSPMTILQTRAIA